MNLSWEQIVLAITAIFGAGGVGALIKAYIDNRGQTRRQQIQSSPEAERTVSEQWAILADRIDKMGAATEKRLEARIDRMRESLRACEAREKEQVAINAEMQGQITYLAETLRANNIRFEERKDADNQ